MPEHDHHRARIDVPRPQQDDGKVALQSLLARDVQPEPVRQQIRSLKPGTVLVHRIARDKIPVLVSRELDLVP